MGGRGPAPKPPEQRARRNRKDNGLKVIEVKPAKQPKLPPLIVSGQLVEWPQQTTDWWKMWGRSPLTQDFTEVDWSELAITAMFHARLMLGSADAGTEYRLRVAKFGATPEDRARLRIAFASADTAESAADKAKAAKKSEQAKNARERIGTLKAVGQ